MSLSYRNISKKVARLRIEGPDRKGIIATITNFLFKKGCNIEDIDQRILEGYLIMNMVIDTSNLEGALPAFLKELKLAAAQVGCTALFTKDESKKVKNVAFLVTKEEHCLVDLIQKMRLGELKGKPTVIIGNQSDLKPLAEKLKIPFHFISSEKKRLHEEKILKLMDKYSIDLIVLARYMQILSPEFVFRQEGKIINIHPSLLPAFPGPRSYHQAFNKGVEIVGVTSHFVTTDLDEGPIITQDCFKVDKTRDTVEKFIQKGRKLEAQVLSRAVKLFLDDRLCLRRGKVIDSKKTHELQKQTRQFYQ